ncbi:MAG: methyltransferase type 12 [Thermoprotei archaeon]|nr:MAG: methyltransferase type 12 [Thermoprotei archaeon]
MSLSKVYKLIKWPEDPKTPAGMKRYQEAIKRMELLLEHEWVKDFMERKYLKILDICSGTGIGGVALAKTLLKRGIKIYLSLVDIREEALKIAKEWAYKELQHEVHVYQMDAKEVHKLKEKFDIVLMYGFSAPHFNPWDLIKLLSSVSSCIKENGIFIIEETDRRYRIFLVGYRDPVVENANEKSLTMSVHVGYDFKKGTIKRAYMDLSKRGEIAYLDTFFWGLAELATLTWIFFEDVDMIQIRGTLHFIIAKNPRNKFSPEEFYKNPKLITAVEQT